MLLTNIKLFKQVYLVIHIYNSSNSLLHLQFQKLDRNNELLEAVSTNLCAFVQVYAKAHNIDIGQY